MAFDGIITRAMANELNERLAGGKIEKIYQPEAEELVFRAEIGRASCRERV